jgi:guanine deaminase
VIDYSNLLIIPGLIDLHLHAPQFPNIGLGLDKELLPWLQTYTFPEESKYSDLEYAKKVYSKLIKELWKYGTTRCCVFATIHKDSSKLLLDLFNTSGLGAYVGKVNMDYNSPDTLIEDTDKSIEDTEDIIKEYKSKYPLVNSIITPRFVPTCSDKLLNALGDLAKKYNTPVQSHLSENRDEIKMVSDRYQNQPNYASVYNSYNLLGDTKTIIAHCIHLTKEEIDLLRDKEVYVAHCPTSNANLSSGIAPIRKLIKNNIKVTS